MGKQKDDTQALHDPYGVVYQPEQVENMRMDNNQWFLTNEQGHTNAIQGTPGSINSTNMPPEMDDPVFQFNDKTIRRAFARKVFAILMVLLLKSATYIAICVYVDPVREFLQSKIGLYFTFFFLIVYMAVILSLICLPFPGRKTPWNYILLLTISTSLTIVVGTVSTIYDGNMVLLAFGITTVLCLSLALFACQTKIDLTPVNMFAVILIFLVISLLLSVFCFPFGYNEGWNLAWVAIGIVIWSIVFIYDVQLIISGSHKYKISPEEHIFAVLRLYLDIMHIFIRILRLLR